MATAGKLGPLAERDPNSSAAKIERLYDAIFDRDGDRPGLAYWVDILDTGVPFSSVVDGFLQSGEAGDFARLGNAAFVERLYVNALGRDPVTSGEDLSGFQFWVAKLEAGGSRASVVIGISDSTEHRGLEQPELDIGLPLFTQAAASVARLYHALLGRVADEDGLEFWVASINGGSSIRDVAAKFLASNEYRATHSGESDQAFVEALYGSALGRSPEAGGLSFWLAELARGVSRADVALGIGGSKEAIGHLGPTLEADFQQLQGRPDPIISTLPASGAEDTGIPLAITVTAPALGAITAVTVSGLTNGATLNHGVDLGNGTWALSPADLTGLVITPGPNRAGDIALTVAATSTDSGGHATTASRDIVVSVSAVADAPTLSVASPAVGTEDAAITLPINVALVDTDGSETASARIAGVPAGAVLNHGVLVGGLWIVAKADLATLTLTPPAQFSGDITLTVTAIATETTGQTALSAPSTLVVRVTPVADAPALTVAPASGSEDGVIPLGITASLVDPSESLSIVISGLQGATLNHGTSNNDGDSFTLSPADLAGLILAPASNVSGALDLTVRAISTESDNAQATTTRHLAVTVSPVADSPNLVVVNPATVNEDSGAIPLAITTSLADPSESLSVRISGLQGGTLSAGAQNPDGSYTLTSGQLQGLTYTPPANLAGTVTLAVTAISTESDGSQATKTASIAVAIAPVADVPVLSLPVGGVAGLEDSAGIPLGIGASSPDGSETVAVTITGVTNGTIVGNGTFNAATHVWAGAASELASLKFVPVGNWNGSVDLTVTAISTDGPDQASSGPQTLTVSVAAVSDAPIVTFADSDGVIPVVASSADIPLGITVALSVSSEVLGDVVTISGVPSDFILSAGAQPEEGGDWVVSVIDLPGLALRSATGETPDFFGPINLGVTATSRDGSAVAAATTATLRVDVAAPVGVTVYRAIDGYIAGATVFADENRDGVLNDGEVSATTASDGTFTLLNAPAGAPLVLQGGTDTSTGLAFFGTLTAPSGSSVVTPLTTLVAKIAYANGAVPSEADLASAQGTVKSALGLSGIGSDLTKFDAVAETAAGTTGASQVLSAAIQVQTTITQISAVATAGTDVLQKLVDAVASAPANGLDLTSSGAGSPLQTIATASGVAADALTSVTAVVAAANVTIAAATSPDATGTTTVLEAFSKAATVALGETTQQLTQAAQAADPTAALASTANTYANPQTLADIVVATPPSAVLFGTSGKDTLTGGPGIDTIDGLDGDDRLDGGAGNDQLFGGDGRDVFVGGLGDDVMDGGSGTDKVLYNTVALSGTQGISVLLAQGVVTGPAEYGTDTLRAVESIRGTSNADTFDARNFGSIATASAPNASGFGLAVAGGLGPQNGFSEFEGVGGDDVIYGNGLSTRVSYLTAAAAVTVNLATGVADSSAANDAAGIGHDTIVSGVLAIRGSEFDDTLTGAANGSFFVEQFDGGAGNDTMDGGAGFDRARYDLIAVAPGGQGISVLLAQGIVTGPVQIGTDTLRSIESIRGTSNADTFDARGFAAALDPNNPQNLNVGGDQGNFNEFEGFAGDDIVYGNGNTRVGFQNAGSAVTVDLQLATAGQAGSTGKATGLQSGTDIFFGGVTAVRGSNFGDTILGTNTTSVTEVFEGWAGDDFIDGRGGFDRVRYDNNPSNGSGVTLPIGVSIQMAAGIVSGRVDPVLDPTGISKLVYGTDTLRSIEAIRGSNAADIYDATGFNAVADPNHPEYLNFGSNGNYNEFEGMDGDDLITGNGFTRLFYSNATAGITVDFSAGNPNIANSTGTIRSIGSGNAAAIGLDTVMAGVASVAGTRFGDNFTGSAGQDLFFGNGGNDTINGGAGIDVAVYNGALFVNNVAQYAITYDPNTPGTQTVQDNTANRDGFDSLVGVEFMEFNDGIYKSNRVLNITNATNLTFGKTLFGGNNALGDDLTVGINASNRLIDLLGGGPDVLKLGQANTFYGLNLLNVEQLVSANGTSNDGVSLARQVLGNSMLVDLGAGTDTLSLANGGNQITVQNVETILGGTGFDTVTLGVAGTVTVMNVESVIGTAGADIVQIGQGASGPTFSATIDLKGGQDTVSLTGIATDANLTLSGVETLTSNGTVQNVTLANGATGLTVDLGFGIHKLTLGNGDNTVSLTNVFEVASFGNHNDTVDFTKGPGTNQVINLGFGTDVVNLKGADGNFALSITGSSTTTINGQTSAATGEHITLLNVQGGTTYDLGAGSNDSLALFAGTGNDVRVQNVETVTGSGNADIIHVLGNSDPAAKTVVTAGGGSDILYASADADVFRFVSVSDSGAGVGVRDIVHDFNAGGDRFDLSGLGFTGFSVAGNVVQLDVNGDQVNDMEIQMINLIGTLSASNFIF